MLSGRLMVDNICIVGIRRNIKHLSQSMRLEARISFGVISSPGPKSAGTEERLAVAV